MPNTIIHIHHFQQQNKLFLLFSLHSESPRIILSSTDISIPLPNHAIPTFSSTRFHKSHHCAEITSASESMDCKEMVENGLKMRSIHHEDYNNRRVFLRSYPLHCGAADVTIIEEMVSATNQNTENKPMKRINWSEGKVLLLRKA